MKWRRPLRLDKTYHSTLLLASRRYYLLEYLRGVMASVNPKLAPAHSKIELTMTHNSLPEVSTEGMALSTKKSCQQNPNWIWQQTAWQVFRTVAKFNQRPGFNHRPGWLCETWVWGLFIVGNSPRKFASHFRSVPFSSELYIASFRALASTMVRLTLLTLRKALSCPPLGKQVGYFKLQII